MFGKYIIDFNRVNELTVNEYRDNHPTENPYDSNRVVTYSLTRNILKDYLQIYREHTEVSRRKKDEGDFYLEKMDMIIKTLIYNKVLIPYSQIRDEEIDKVLED